MGTKIDLAWSFIVVAIVMVIDTKYGYDLLDALAFTIMRG